MKTGLTHTKNLAFSIIILITAFLFIELTAALITGNPESEIPKSESLPLWVLSNIEDSNFIPDRYLFWRVPASNHRLGTNSLGLRGLEFSPEKEPGVFRIITMGDSCTWGFGVELLKEYPWILQKMLNNTRVSKIFEVQNAGVPGYSSLQGLRYFQTELHLYQPDIVTLYFGRNDSRKLNEEGGYAPDHEVYVPSEPIYYLRKLLNHSQTYRLLRSTLLQLKRNTGSSNLIRGESKRSGRRFRIESDEFETNLLDLITEIKRLNSIPIAITSPVSPPNTGNYNELIRKICREQGVLLVDAAAEFEQIGAGNLLVDDCHPNENGHVRIAEMLKRLILTLADPDVKSRNRTKK